MAIKEKLKFVFLKLTKVFWNGVYDFEGEKYIPIKECLGEDGQEYVLFCSKKGFDIRILKTIVEETGEHYINLSSNKSSIELI